MRIAVLGSGAMGSVFGGKLTESGEDVTLIDVWKEHVDTMNKDGLHLEGIGGDRFIPVKAVTSTGNIDGKVDLIIVFVKSSFTETAVKEALPIVGEDTLVMTVQNGLGNAEKIAGIVGEKRTIAGVTGNGGTLLGPGHVRHAGVGDTIIGPLNGDVTEKVEEVARVLSKAGLPAKVSTNVPGLIWGKLIANIGINALTAILRVQNGYLVEHRNAEKLMEQAVKEAVEVCNAKGIKLEYDDPVEHCKDVARATATNFSSMYQDMSNKRITEIDYINGAVVSEGAKLGIPTPVNEVLVELIKALEEGY
ncbi:MAG: ketopantoate reductase family protein [Thermoanaerobacteraceae bacterium]|nr:ketopantoate reductase family protein [Thermoanaerobacteraceae bacterium]